MRGFCCVVLTIFMGCMMLPAQVIRERQVNPPPSDPPDVLLAKLQADPDDAREEVDWATAQLPMPRPKAHASLRLDADMLDWFKAPVAVIKRASMRCYAVTFSNRRGERIVPQRSFTRHIGESAPRA